MTTTRYLCPLDCGWHHDQDSASVPPQLAVDADVLASGDLEAITSAVAFAQLKATLEQEEDVVRAHLETHELIEWARALNVVKGERDLYRKEVGVSHDDSKKLRQMLGREYGAHQDAEAVLAAVREYVETSDDDGILTRETVLRMLGDVPTPVGMPAGTSNEPTAAVETDTPGLSRAELAEERDRLATDLYRAQDVLAFVREMCDAADRNGESVTTEQVRAWTRYEGCGGAIVMPGSLAGELAGSLRRAMGAFKPGADPALCPHPNARRSSVETMQAGWGRRTVHTVSCPDCPAHAESGDGEPMMEPWVFNAERCTVACAEQHTYRQGCLMRPVLPGEEQR